MGRTEAVWLFAVLCSLAACAPTGESGRAEPVPPGQAHQRAAEGPTYVEGLSSTPPPAALSQATVTVPGGVALRSEPSAESGREVARIPDGAAVEVYEWAPTMTMADGVDGQWCQVGVDGQSGWVFNPDLAPVLH